MQLNKSWKIYNDDWNMDNFNLDVENKKIFMSLNEYVADVSLKVSNADSSSNCDIVKSNFQSSISFDDMKQILESTDFKKNNVSDVALLSDIIKVIGWCIEYSNDVDKYYDNYIRSLTWICNSIEYFMTELNIQKITNKQYNGLNRSSYKLCPNKSNCTYQYPDNNNTHTCKFQHFPYDNLYLDCNSILQYVNECYNDSIDNASKTSKLVKALSNRNINYNGKSDDDIHYENNPNSDPLDTNKISGNEMKRCLTTLNYVFMIMYRELDVIDRTRKMEPNYNIRRYHSYHTLFKFDNSSERNRWTDGSRHSSNIEYRNSTRGSSHSFRGRGSSRGRF